MKTNLLKLKILLTEETSNSTGDSTRFIIFRFWIWRRSQRYW